MSSYGSVQNWPGIMENTGVQSINDVFHIVVKVENVCVNKYIFDLNDNVEYVVYALYSRINTLQNAKLEPISTF